MSSFSNVKETNMSIDQHIEELRAELRNAVYRDERRETEAALELALAEREVMLAEAHGEVSAEPPF
ncbi:MAG: hypothetical protein BGO03_11135 [Mesorhizobium sp. 61-13]|nr:MAG: hypothetical protein BGO03_11135 [Mesorhizobium sp. 61-13]